MRAPPPTSEAGHPQRARLSSEPRGIEGHVHLGHKKGAIDAPCTQFLRHGDPIHAQK
jgi:hypothetical protein